MCSTIIILIAYPLKIQTKHKFNAEIIKIGFKIVQQSTMRGNTEEYGSICLNSKNLPDKTIIQ